MCANNSYSQGPQQVHIALTSRPDAIIVIWVTKDKVLLTAFSTFFSVVIAYPQVSSEAFFGTSSNVMNEGRNGTVTTYTAGILGSPPLFSPSLSPLILHGDRWLEGLGAYRRAQRLVP